ncbi:MAG: hypothetical protein HY537_04655 [Deltaproteobacteria bacterium]|nr:hypothetical protein [Deltaproteobacteria bacterium]
MKNQSLNTSAWRQLVFIATSALFVCFTGHTSSTSTHSLDRELASRALPVLRETRDQGEILNNYPQYLWFVLEIGKDVDPKTASQLNTLYQSMRKKNREAAANFLKGLRFEIVQKADFMGA